MGGLPAGSLCVAGGLGVSAQGVGPAPGALTVAPTAARGLDGSVACSPHLAMVPGAAPVPGERAGRGSRRPGRSPQGVDPGPAVHTVGAPVVIWKPGARGPSHPSRCRVDPCRAPCPLLSLAPSHHTCGAAPGPQEGRVQWQPPLSGLRPPRARPLLALQDPGWPLSPWSGKPCGRGEGRACSVSYEPRGLGQWSRGGHQAQGSRFWLVPGRPGVHTPPQPPRLLRSL